MRLLAFNAARQLVMARLRSSCFGSLGSCFRTRRKLELELELEVTAEGTVVCIRLIPDVGPRDPLAACIAREARSWTFDALPGCQAITLSLRLGSS